MPRLEYRLQPGFLGRLKTRLESQEIRLESQAKHSFVRNSSQKYQNVNCDDFLPLNIPPGASVDANMRTTAETRDMYNRSGDKLNAVLHLDYRFKMQVRDRGRWDYKYKSDDHNLYEPFGNFNYGAVGAAAGYSLDTLYRVAGWIQQHGGDAKSGRGTLSPSLAITRRGSASMTAQLVHIHSGRQWRPMRSITARTSPRCRKCWGIPASPPRGSMTVAPPGRKTAPHSR